jgi:hypothetical protein
MSPEAVKTNSARYMLAHAVHGLLVIVHSDLRMLVSLCVSFGIIVRMCV